MRDTASAYRPWRLLLPLTASAGFWLDGVFVGATLAREMRNTMILATALFFPVWWLTSGWDNHGLWLAMNLWMASRGGADGVGVVSDHLGRMNFISVMNHIRWPGSPSTLMSPACMPSMNAI